MAHRGDGCLQPSGRAPSRACAASRSAEEDLLARERRRVVRRALPDLSRPSAPRALILRSYGAWSFDRIAARLGVCKATTARASIARCSTTSRPHRDPERPAGARPLVIQAGAQRFDLDDDQVTGDPQAPERRCGARSSFYENYVFFID